VLVLPDPCRAGWRRRNARTRPGDESRRLEDGRLRALAASGREADASRRGTASLAGARRGDRQPTSPPVPASDRGHRKSRLSTTSVGGGFVDNPVDCRRPATNVRHPH
jgi:hypothetical protein